MTEQGCYVHVALKNCKFYLSRYKNIVEYWREKNNGFS